MPSEETHQQRLARAKGYPYARPDSSYIYLNGAAHPFKNSEWRGPTSLGQLPVHVKHDHYGSLTELLTQQGVDPSLLKGPWTPILAIGSNAAPEQLARKFPRSLFPQGVVLPVVQCVLCDFDVVYAPLLSSYGSCTATLEHSPGTRVSLFVTYLTPALQERMHQTEGAYNLCMLNDVQLHEAVSLREFCEERRSSRMLSSILQYNHQHGTLHVHAEDHTQGVTPIALAEILAAQRRFPALHQTQQLALLRAALDVEMRVLRSVQLARFLTHSPHNLHAQQLSQDAAPHPAATPATAQPAGGASSEPSAAAVKVTVVSSATPQPAGCVPDAAAGKLSVGGQHDPSDTAQPAMSSMSGAAATQAPVAGADASAEGFESEPEDDLLDEPEAIAAMQMLTGDAVAEVSKLAMQTVQAAGEHDHGALDEWIASYLVDPKLRGAYVQLLAQHARPFGYAATEVVLAIGGMHSRNVC